MSNGINSNGNPPDFDVWARGQGLDPMTMLPIKATKQSSIEPPPDMSGVLSTTPSQIEGEDLLYSLRKRDINVYADSDLDELLEARAEKQGVPEVAANAGLRFLVGQFGEYASVAGGLAEAPKHIASWFGVETEFGNALTEWGDEFKKTVDEEWFPIYRSKDRDFMDIGDPEWWLENGSSLQRSATGFVVGGLVASAGLGAIGKGINLGSKAARGTTLLEALGMSPSTALRAEGGVQTLANAYLLNHAEGVMEATDVYNTSYQDLLSKGYSEEEAKAQASLGASATINANRLNILLNLTSAAKFLKPFGSSRNIIEMPSFKKGLKTALFEGGQEFLEEEINLLASEYGRGVAMGEVPNLAKGMDKVLSMEGLETGFLGMLGGIAQTGMTNLANSTKANPVTRVKTEEGYISKNDFIKKQAERQQELLNSYSQMLNPEEVKKLTTVFNSNQETLNDLQEIEKAFRNNDEVKLKELQAREFGYQATQAFMSGTTEQYLDTMQKATEALVASTEDPVLAKQYQQRGRLAVDMVTNLEKKYNNNEILINRMDIKGNPEEVNQFKNYMKFKVNSINTRSWLAKNSADTLEGMLAGEEIEGAEAAPLKGFVDPYVQKQAKELDKFKTQYLDWMNPASAQAKFDEWSKQQEEVQKNINKETQKEDETDLDIQAFKDAVSAAGYSQRADENITDLPDIGRVSGVHIQIDNRLFRLTREGDNQLKLVSLEKDITIPFTRDFLRDNISKIKILTAEGVKDIFNKKKQRALKFNQIKTIEKVITDYNSRKETIDKEINEYEEQIQNTLKVLDTLKQKIKDSRRDKQLQVSLKKEKQELENTIKLGEQIIADLEEKKSLVENAQQELLSIRESYIKSFDDLAAPFQSIEEVRNEFKRQEAENYYTQKDRNILNDSEEEISKAIFYINQSLERLRKKQAALLKTLEALDLADQEAVKKFNTLRKITQEITELENELKEYKTDLDLKQEATKLKNTLSMLDAHMTALKKRAEQLLEKPVDAENNLAEPSSDTEITDEQENEVFEQKKSTSPFATTGQNIIFDTKRKADTYNEEGIPVLNQNILEKSWFERLDKEGIKEGEYLMILRYNPNPQTDKDNMYNDIIRKRLGAGYAPGSEDILVMIMKDGQPVNYQTIQFNDKGEKEDGPVVPLVSVLGLPDTMLKSFDEARINAYGLINTYAAANGASIEYKPGSNFYTVFYEGKTVIRELTEEHKAKILETVKRVYTENINKLKQGDTLEIDGLTLGNPMRKKKWVNGKLINDYRPFGKVFKDKFYIKEVTDSKGKKKYVPNFKIEVVVSSEPKGKFSFKGQVYTVPTGTAVISSEDTFKFLYNRTLNEEEIDTVLHLLTMEQNKEIPLPEGKFMIANGEKVTSVPVFPFSKNADKRSPLSILSSLVKYGVKDIKAPYLGGGDFYRAKNKIYYKYNGVDSSIAVSDLLNPELNQDFKKFLAEKRVPINNNYVNSPGMFYKAYVDTTTGTPQVKFKTYGSYAQYIINDAAETNAYITPEGQVMASKNVVLKTDERGNLIINGKKPAAVKVEPMPTEGIPELEYEPFKGSPEIGKDASAEDKERGKELAKMALISLNKFKDGIYKFQETISKEEKNGFLQVVNVKSSYFTVKNGVFYPAPKGFNSMSLAEIDELNKNNTSKLKDFAGEQQDGYIHTFSIDDYAAPKSIQPKVSKPVTTEVKIGDTVVVNTPKNREGVVQELRGDKVLLTDGRQIMIKNLTVKQSTTKTVTPKSEVEKRIQEVNNQFEKYNDEISKINFDEVDKREELIQKLLSKYNVTIPQNIRIVNWSVEELVNGKWKVFDIKTKGGQEVFFGKENWENIVKSKKEFDIEFKKIEEPNLEKINIIEQKQRDLLSTIDGLKLRKAWSLGLIEEPNIIGLDSENFVEKETHFVKGELVEKENYIGYYYLPNTKQGEDWTEDIKGKTKQEVIDKINAKYDAELAALNQGPEAKTEMFETTEKVVSEKTTEEKTIPSEEDFLQGRDTQIETPIVETEDKLDAATKESLIAQITASSLAEQPKRNLIKKVNQSDTITDDLVNEIQKRCAGQ